MKNQKIELSIIEALVLAAATAAVGTGIVAAAAGLTSYYGAAAITAGLAALGGSIMGGVFVAIVSGGLIVGTVVVTAPRVGRSLKAAFLAAKQAFTVTYKAA